MSHDGQPWRSCYSHLPCVLLTSHKFHNQFLIYKSFQYFHTSLQVAEKGFNFKNLKVKSIHIQLGDLQLFQLISPHSVASDDAVGFYTVYVW